jgi:hypothetical protein
MPPIPPIKLVLGWSNGTATLVGSGGVTVLSGVVTGDQTVTVNIRHQHVHFHIHAAHRGAAKSSDEMDRASNSRSETS